MHTWRTQKQNNHNLSYDSHVASSTWNREAVWFLWLSYRQSFAKIMNCIFNGSVWLRVYLVAMCVYLFRRRWNIPGHLPRFQQHGVPQSREALPQTVQQECGRGGWGQPTNEWWAWKDRWNWGRRRGCVSITWPDHVMSSALNPAAACVTSCLHEHWLKWVSLDSTDVYFLPFFLTSGMLNQEV